MRAETEERVQHARWGRRKNWASSMQYHIAQPDGSTRMDEILGLRCCKNKETTAERDRGAEHWYYDSPSCG